MPKAQSCESIDRLEEINILQQYKDIVDQSTIVSKSDLTGKITFVNDKFCKISGYTKEELIGQQHSAIRDPDMPKSVFKDMWDTIQNKEVWTGQIKNRRKDGGSYYVDATICPILDKNGDIIEYIGLRNDITGIINPKKQLLDAIKMMTRPFLVIIKIENFTSLEHLYSKEIIERLLMLLESQITHYLPHGFVFDKVFNLDNGEFAFLKQMKTDDSSATQKELQLKLFQRNVKQTDFTVGEYDIDISILISFSTIKEDIYDNVKLGLEVAKETQRDIVFANGLKKKAKENAVKNSKIIKMIQTAIEKNKIISYFQPIINNKTMEIEKYESLVRLIDEDDKVISPFFFLDIAKEGRYYNKITHIVIENSFAALEYTDKEISINLSALDIEDLETRNKLISLVTASMHNTHRIVFELLEDEHVKDFEVVKDFISLVKTFGVQIAIDDFGAGVSNFERLLDYQPDILKIDACLIKNIETDQYSRDVVETIQAFATKQRIKTVAEFVSNEGILEIIKDIEIDYSQGFLLGKPEPLKV
ncbi:MAG: EAL domain-containing protein [Arcobacteraceae bacterium]|nr:EAL domain-containing protein [Arcobacteraceae bacterium]